MIKNLVRHVVSELVESPDQVKVEVFHDGPKTVVEIKVSPDDFKRVIGKDGRIIKSIRSLINAVDASQDKELVVDIAKV